MPFASGRLRIDNGFAPLTQLRPARTTRTRQGRLAVVSVSVSAACLGKACATGIGAVAIAPPPVTVQVRTRRGVTLRRTARWSPLHVTSRVAAADLAVAEPPFRHDALPPPPGYLIAPARLRARSTFLLPCSPRPVSVSRRGRDSPSGTVAVRRPPSTRTRSSSRSCGLREVKARPAPERRRALGLLARLLDARDRRLAGAARELAWSKPAPEPEALSAFVAEVERTVVS